MKFLTTFICLLLLSGCANRSGIAEFTQYRNAFDSSQAATNNLIDNLAVIERKRGQSNARTQLESLVNSNKNNEKEKALSFNIEHTNIWSTLAGPPLASALKDAYTAISKYNTAMMALASGKTSDALLEDATDMASSALNLGKTIGANIDPKLSILFTMAKSLAKIGLDYKSREVFRTELIKSSPLVRKSLLLLQAEGSALIFQLTAAKEIHLLRNAHDDIAFNVKGKPTQKQITSNIDSLEKKRTLLSDWVVLLEKNIVALDAAVSAVKNPKSTIDLAIAKQVIEDINRAADAINKGLAELKSA